MNVFSLIIICTLVDILYSFTLSGTPTPSILIGVPSLNPWSNTVVTVMIGPAVPPLPDSILAIDNGSEANAPTISHSGLCFAKASGSSGYFL